VLTVDNDFVQALDWAATELAVPGPSPSESVEETSHRLRRTARRRGNKRVVRYLRSELSNYLDRLHP
jgi:hypothetical protein